MKMFNIDKHIVANPRICHGTPIFRGTRVMVWQVLELLEENKQSKEIYAAFPSLPKGAVEAALHYAAEKAKGINYVPFNPKTSEQTLVFAG